MHLEMAKQNSSSIQVPQQQQQPQRSQQLSRRREIYRYTAAEPLFASSWSNMVDGQFRMAVGTIIDDENFHNNNKVKLFICLFIC